jgi:hypothetical protein
LEFGLDYYFVVRETSGGEKRDLLSTSNGVHGIDGRDTGLNHLFRINSRVRVDRLSFSQ